MGVIAMSEKKRLVSVVVVACLYIAVGAAAFAFYFPTLLKGQPDAVWIELTELLAIVAGIFLLRGHNWARWLALAWIGFHVVLSAFHILREFAVHAAFCAVIAWVLFRPAAANYFRGPRREAA
ncbi:MAG: hypothetical protein WAM85_11825 [Terracidiphilus sp.]